jgi:hypothetical protein
MASHQPKKIKIAIDRTPILCITECSMEHEHPAPITKEEARASLAEIDRIILLTRQGIARAGSAPIVIMWGIIWIVGFSGVQFFPQAMNRLWTVLDAIGITGSFLFGAWSRKSPTKSPYHGKIGLSWLILFVFGAIWLCLFAPWRAAAGVAHPAQLGRQIAAYWSTIPMFAYVIMGLWLDRFFVWLGALVTIATLVGFYCITDYFFLWMAVVGGGSLVAGGIFIRKYWK